MTSLAILSGIGIGIAGLIFGCGLLITLFWVWMLVDCARRIGAGQTRLVGWLIAICFLHALGALAYLLFARRNQPVQHAPAF